MTNVQEIINRIIEGAGVMSSSKERQKVKKGLDNSQQYPKVPSGFQCFVCGRQFSTNEERIQHLEKDPHGGMYDTASPQESEDTRRLR
ncbi:MAG TPA: hypothetical protein VE445_09370 [Nitrososphaeraceae archaeon]|jgi:hypothetical protein|nr:hypothetical protein [Nitrososphaeraceae archaeon]